MVTAARPRPLLWGVQPPPPAKPPPPRATPPPGGAYPSPPVAGPPPRRGSPGPWIVLGCGCLALITIVALGSVIGLHQYRKAQIERLLQNAPKVPPPSTPTPHGAASGSPHEPSAAAVSEQPGKDAALRVALAGKSGWVGKINYASADWQRVRVWIGPPESEYTTAVALQWDADGNLYKVESAEALPAVDVPAALERPAAKPKVIATTDHPAPPDDPQPSRRRAMAKCLAQAPESGWVAKVVEANADYTEVTVMIGPPQSEFIAQYRLHWVPETHNYAVTGRSNVGD